MEYESQHLSNQGATEPTSLAPNLNELRGSMKGARAFVRDRTDRLERYAHLKSAHHVDYSERIRVLINNLKKAQP
jgi:hypothetical protein